MAKLRFLFFGGIGGVDPHAKGILALYLNITNIRCAARHSHYKYTEENV